MGERERGNLSASIRTGEGADGDKKEEEKLGSLGRIVVIASVLGADL